MNKTIDELLGQALDEVIPNTWSTLTPEQVTKLSEKFSELIVEKCVNICLEKHYNWRWDNEPDSDSGPRDCANSIKQHFGVTDE